MARFTSILFTDPKHAAGISEWEQPEFFGDLHLDQIVDAVVTDNADHLDRFFYAPLHDVSAVHYRHDVFRDLQRAHLRAPIDAFVAGMRTMRQRLDRASQLWHPLQQQGWFVYAVEAFCDTLTTLSDELSRIDPASQGLTDFADYVAAYLESGRFQTLVDETRSVQADLREIRYTVHIEGLKVHVDTYDGQRDYSDDIAATFERFASQTTKDYHVVVKEFAEMNHVEEQILECVAKLHPEPFRQLRRVLHKASQLPRSHHRPL